MLLRIGHKFHGSFINVLEWFKAFSDIHRSHKRQGAKQLLFRKKNFVLTLLLNNLSNLKLKQNLHTKHNVYINTTNLHYQTFRDKTIKDKIFLPILICVQYLLPFDE